MPIDPIRAVQLLPKGLLVLAVFGTPFLAWILL